MKKEAKKYTKDNLKTQDVKRAHASLKFLRFVMMFAKVVSMIVFVASIIFTVFCTAGSICVIQNKDVIWDGIRTFETVIYNTYGVSVYTASLELISCAILAAGSIAVSWFCWRFFGNMFRDKTPFTFKTARAGIRLAIIAAGCGVVGLGLQGLAHGIYLINFGDKVQCTFYIQWVHIVIAVLALILSFINRYGAQLREDANAANK